MMSSIGSDASMRTSLRSKPQQHHPYRSSIASSASSSSSSVFSTDGLSSQSSAPSSSKTSLSSNWDSDQGNLAYVHNEYQLPLADNSCDGSHTASLSTVVHDQSGEQVVAPELRQHPRRTQPPVQLNLQNGASAALGLRLPPTLVRQCERKGNFVESLVDTTAQMIEAIWPLSVVSCSRDTVLGGKTVLGLRTFIQEVLKRSKTSYSTLQVALYYLVLIKAFVPKCDFTMEQFDDSNASRAMQCGRRMFLAALILASKYLQDRNYSARAWSKISGLKVCEINTNEMAFLLAVNWKLHIPESLFQRWTDVVLKYSSAQSDQATADLLRSWKAVVLQLTPELDNLDALDVLNEPASPSCPTDWSTVNLKEDWGMSCKSGYDLALRSTLPQPTSAPRLCSPPRFSSPFSSSNEQTPTNSFAIPQVLEPTPRESSSITGKLPPMLTLGPLPTPHMTPHAVNNFCTPAVSASGSCSRRSSMGYAMKQVHNTNLNQSAFDMWKQNPYPAFPTSARRSSLARSVSSMSSPESMISDTSSRSSRSSSISSIASSTCALPQPRLAVQATRRCAKMQLSGIKEDSRPTCFPLTNSDGSWAAYTASPDACGGNSSLDFHKLSVAQSQSQQCLAMPTPHDLSDQEAAEGLRELALNLPRNPPQSLLQPGSQSSLTRKRERTESADLTPIQQNVRALLNQRCLNDVTNNSNTRIEDDGMGVLPDTNIADSFLSTENNSRLSELKSLLKENSNGRKRVCYDARIAAPAMPFMAHGPGMWSDIL